MAGPLVLGAARLWIELPLLCGVALLLMVQGLRLNSRLAGSLPRVDIIDLTVILFTLYAIVRWLTSPTEYFSRLEAMNVFAYAVVFLTCRHGLVRRTHGLILIYLLVVLGLFETGFGYYLVNHRDFFPFGPTERLQLYYTPRWVGTYGCPNHYVSLLVMAIGAALAIGSFSKLSWPVRILFFYAAAMMLAGVMYSGSRGGWLALPASVFGLALFGVRQGTLRWWIPVTGAALLIISFGMVLCLSPFVQERFSEVRDVFQNNKLDRYVRLELARDALRIAQDNPVLGTGPATFIFIHPRYQSSTFSKKAMLAHDDYLNCLDDYGIVGFGIVMLFVALVTLKFFHQLRIDNRWPDRVLAGCGLAAWMALLVHSFVDFNMHIPANAFMFFALIGLGLRGIGGDEEKPHWSSLSLKPLTGWLGWILIALSVAFGVQTVRSAMSDIVYEETMDDATVMPTIQSIQGAQDALTFDRGNAQAMVLLGDLYRYRASRQKDITDRINEGQKALDAYKAADKANPLDDAIQAKMGMTFDVMRRYPEAFFCYKTAATMQPHNGQFWNALGNHFWQRGFLAQAEEAYLLAAQCPHGFERSAEAAAELRSVLDKNGVPPPKPGANPLAPQPVLEEPATTP